MKKIIKIVFLIFLAVIVLGIFFINFKLKAIVTKELSKSLKRPVSIEKVGIKFPLNIYLKNLIVFDFPLEENKPIESLIKEGKNLEEFISIKELEVSPGIIPLLNRKILIYSLVINQPRLRIVRLEREKFNFSNMFPPQGEKAKGKEKGVSLLLLKFKIDAGSIDFIDKTLVEPFIVSIRNIDFSVSKLAFPLADVATRYELRADLGVGDGKEVAKVDSSGWVNLTRKDMEARLSLNNLNYLNVRPYLGEFISGRIHQGIFNLYADMFSKNNDLNLKCRVELEKIVTGDLSSKILGIPLERIKQALQDKEGKISFLFEINTKFDNPKIDYAKIGSSLWQQITEKLSGRTPKIILEDIVDRTLFDKLQKIKEKIKENSGD